MIALTPFIFMDFSTHHFRQKEERPSIEEHLGPNLYLPSKLFMLYIDIPQSP